MTTEPTTYDAADAKPAAGPARSASVESRDDATERPSSRSSASVTGVERHSALASRIHTDSPFRSAGAAYFRELAVEGSVERLVVVEGGDEISARGVAALHRAAVEPDVPALERGIIGVLLHHAVHAA